MKVPVLVFFLVSGVSAAFADSSATEAEAERAEVAVLLAGMAAAANAHDVERHVGFYAHDPLVTLIFNGVPIVGWENIREKQREWWMNGKTDVIYSMVGKPEYQEPAPGIVVTTLLLKSRSTRPSGEVKEGAFAVSAIWQKRPEGWRVIYSHESTSQ